MGDSGMLLDVSTLASSAAWVVFPVRIATKSVDAISKRLSFAALMAGLLIGVYSRPYVRPYRI